MKKKLTPKFEFNQWVKYMSRSNKYTSWRIVKVDHELQKYHLQRATPQGGVKISALSFAKQYGWKRDRQAEEKAFDIPV